MVTPQIDPDLHKEFEAVASASGCELLDFEFQGGVLRLTIDKLEGVTLEDCQAVSRQISTLLDVADFGERRYVLEVSSPGLNRKFYADSDYKRYLNQQIRVTWLPENQHRKRTDVGLLAEYDTDRKQILVTLEADEEIVAIPLHTIEIARLEPEF